MILGSLRELKMKVDYSPKAISRRLRAVDELRDLCKTLAGPRLKYPLRTEKEKQAVKEAFEKYEIKNGKEER